MKLKRDELLSNFAFNFSLRPCMKGKPGSGPVLSAHSMLATPSYWQGSASPYTMVDSSIVHHSIWSHLPSPYTCPLTTSRSPT